MNKEQNTIEEELKKGISGKVTHLEAGGSTYILAEEVRHALEEMGLEKTPSYTVKNDYWECLNDGYNEAKKDLAEKREEVIKKYDL